MDADASPQRTYTPEQREEALRLVAEHGPAEASRRLTIPAGTVRSWAWRYGVATPVPESERTRAATDAAKLSWAQRRLELAKETGAVAADLLERIREATKAADVRSLASGFGVLVEKAQLLDGAVTERVEISDGERRERVAAMRDEIAARRSAKSG
jgi:transposase-like protein